MIKSKEREKVYLNMGRILMFSFSDFEIKSYGVVFSNPVDDGEDEYVFKNKKVSKYLMDEKNNISIAAGSYLHSYIKLSLYCTEINQFSREFELVGTYSRNLYKKAYM